jgi:hypothetical protein
MISAVAQKVISNHFKTCRQFCASVDVPFLV